MRGEVYNGQSRHSIGKQCGKGFVLAATDQPDTKEVADRVEQQRYKTAILTSVPGTRRRSFTADYHSCHADLELEVAVSYQCRCWRHGFGVFDAVLELAKALVTIASVLQWLESAINFSRD